MLLLWPDKVIHHKLSDFKNSNKTQINDLATNFQETAQPEFDRFIQAVTANQDLIVHM